MGFIEEIAPLIQKYAPKYNIAVCSPIIAQAVLESASGTSELAKNARNYFGLKYRAGRCPSASGIYYKVGSEQLANGSYVSSNMQWCKFDTMEKGVQGYFDFTNISTYKNLKGVKDPETYLKLIKQDGYATSLNYVSNLMAVIKKYNLTQYDTPTGVVTTSKPSASKAFNIHAGHAAVGGGAIGAVGLISESIEDRIIKDKVIALLKKQGHTVYDCTVDKGTQSQVLNSIVAKCNAHAVDLDVSIHFNSGANRRNTDGKTTGSEVFVYDANSKAKTAATRICKELEKVGFKNRGVKYSTSLTFLKKTKSPSLLIEVCFVDDGDDVVLYNKKKDDIARAIVSGLLGETVTASVPSKVETAVSGDKIVKIKTDGLNIRKGPGTNYDVVGAVKKNIKYTIVEVKGSWGRLKSGAGWINISTKYVDYV